VPGITGPASGSAINAACKAAYSASVKYSSTSFVNARVSMKLNMHRLYGIAVQRQILGGGANYGPTGRSWPVLARQPTAPKQPFPILDRSYGS
jgi:hypothetical protein